jgi:PKD domain
MSLSWPATLRVARLAAVWLAGLLMLGAGTAAAAPSHSAHSHRRPARHGRIGGIVPTKSLIRSRARTATVSLLDYHGGQVMHSNRVHAIFWFPAGYTLPPAYRSVIDQYLSDVAAASGASTNVYSTDPQYTDTTGAAAYSSSVASDIVDTNAFPATQGCADAATAVCYSDGQITSEIDRLIAQAPGGPLPRGSRDLYLLFTPPNVGTCYDAQNCSFQQFCAYHSDFGQGSADTLYANMPYGAFDTHGGCGPTESLNGNPAADLEVSLISHEHNETITDPFGSGWYAADGQENGDECAYNYGELQGGDLSSGQAYNQVIGSDHYLLQQEWSNSAAACVQSAGSAPAVAPPTAAIAAPTSVPVGTAATFSAATSTSAPGHSASYAWSFGDGATGAGASIAHQYADQGPHTVTLTVTQDDAQTASASQVVTAVAPPPVAAPAAVSAVPSPAPAPAPTTPATTSGPTGRSVQVAVQVRVPAQGLAAVLRHGLTLTLTSRDLSTARIQVSVDATTARRLHLKRRVVGAAQLGLTAGRPATLALRIDQALRSALRHRQHVRLALHVTVTRSDTTTSSIQQQVDLSA